jgi:hypothetical protein
VEIMGSQKCRLVGKSQSVLIMISPHYGPRRPPRCRACVLPSRGGAAVPLCVRAAECGLGADHGDAATHPPPPPPAPQVCDGDNSTCLVRDCDGRQAPRHWLGDGHCDDGSARALRPQPDAGWDHLASSWWRRCGGRFVSVLAAVLTDSYPM